MLYISLNLVYHALSNQHLECNVFVYINLLFLNHSPRRPWLKPKSYIVSRVLGKPAFCLCENKDTGPFCSNCSVFATQSFQLLNSKFQGTSLFLRLYRQVCVGPGRKPQRLFCCRFFFVSQPIVHLGYHNHESQHDKTYLGVQKKVQQ